jgi:glycosyltransferase involved in cell wall biosynthesis
MRLLWVVPDLPIRGVAAARERFWNLLARLAPRHEVTLLALVDPDDAGREPELPRDLAAVHLVQKMPFRPTDPLALLPRTVAGGYTNPAIRAAIGDRLARERFDVVQYEFSEMAHCIPAVAPRSILTVHQISFAQEADAWRAAGRGVRRGAVFLHRYLRELDFELRAVHRVDHVVAMSAEDAARLRRFVPDLPVSVSPCGVDCDAFRPRDVRPDVDVVFVGHFGHPPNVDAAVFLVREVVPRIGRPVRIRIVGRAPTPDVARLASTAGVELAAAVEDVRPHLAAARVAVAPVRFGTGMRGKVLEALAMGRPVVTTRLGAEGLGATPGRELLVAEGADEIAAAVRRVLDDTSLATALGAAGRALAVARFDWDAIAAAHEAIYEQVVRGPARATLGPASPGRLERVGAALGYGPGVALGFALLLARAARAHAAKLGRGGSRAVASAPAALEA